MQPKPRANQIHRLPVKITYDVQPSPIHLVTCSQDFLAAFVHPHSSSKRAKRKHRNYGMSRDGSMEDMEDGEPPGHESYSSDENPLDGGKASLYLRDVANCLIIASPELDPTYPDSIHYTIYSQSQSQSQSQARSILNNPRCHPAQYPSYQPQAAVPSMTHSSSVYPSSSPYLHPIDHIHNPYHPSSQWNQTFTTPDQSPTSTLTGKGLLSWACDQTDPTSNNTLIQGELVLSEDFVPPRKRKEKSVESRKGLQGLAALLAQEGEDDDFDDDEEEDEEEEEEERQMGWGIEVVLSLKPLENRLVIDRNHFLQNFIPKSKSRSLLSSSDPIPNPEPDSSNTSSSSMTIPPLPPRGRKADRIILSNKNPIDSIDGLSYRPIGSLARKTPSAVLSLLEGGAGSISQTTKERKSIGIADMVPTAHAQSQSQSQMGQVMVPAGRPVRGPAPGPSGLKRKNVLMIPAPVPTTRTNEHEKFKPIREDVVVTGGGIEVRKNVLGVGEIPRCGNCGRTETCTWRMKGNMRVCNACGIYWNSRRIMRPQELWGRPMHDWREKKPKIEGTNISPPIEQVSTPQEVQQQTPLSSVERVDSGSTKSSGGTVRDRKRTRFDSPSRPRIASERIVKLSAFASGKAGFKRTLSTMAEREAERRAEQRKLVQGQGNSGNGSRKGFLQTKFIKMTQQENGSGGDYQQHLHVQGPAQSNNPFVNDNNPANILRQLMAQANPSAMSTVLHNSLNLPLSDDSGENVVPPFPTSCIDSPLRGDPRVSNQRQGGHLAEHMQTEEGLDALFRLSQSSSGSTDQEAAITEPLSQDDADDSDIHGNHQHGYNGHQMNEFSYVSMALPGDSFDMFDAYVDHSFSSPLDLDLLGSVGESPLDPSQLPPSSPPLFYSHESKKTSSLFGSSPSTSIEGLTPCPVVGEHWLQDAMLEDGYGMAEDRDDSEMVY